MEKHTSKHNNDSRQSPNGQFPPLMNSFLRTQSSRSRSLSSAASSLSSSSSSSRASSRRSTASSSRSSKHSRQNLDAIIEEYENRKNVVTHRLLSGAVGNTRGDSHSPPPSRVHTGAHYLKWYIPPHIAGSRALSRNSKSARERVNVLSPLHNPEKQSWLDDIINNKTTSLPFPPPHPLPLVDHSDLSAQRAENLLQAFEKHQMDKSPSMYFSGHPPSSYSKIKRSEPPTLKSLLLEHDKQAHFSEDDKLDPLSTSVFTNSHLPVYGWYVVHPDWRKEPGRR